MYRPGLNKTAAQVGATNTGSGMINHFKNMPTTEKMIYVGGAAFAVWYFFIKKK